MSSSVSLAYCLVNLVHQAFLRGLVASISESVQKPNSTFTEPPHFLCGICA